MNLFARSLIVGFLFLGLAWRSNCYAQTSEPAAPSTSSGGIAIPLDIQTQTNILLKSADPIEVDTAITWFKNQNTSAASQAARVSFQQQVSGAFIDLLGNKDVGANARLRMATVAESFGIRATDDTLTPLVATLISDKYPATVFHGQLGAGPVITSALTLHPKAPETKVLMDAMVTCVQKNTEPPLGGRIAKAAFENVLTFYQKPQGLLIGDGFNLWMDTTLRMGQARIDQYQQGVPQLPQVDDYLSLNFFDPAIWAKMNATQQLGAVQETSDLVSCIGQSIAKPANGALVGDFVTALQRLGTQMDNLSKASPSTFPNLTSFKDLSGVSRFGKLTGVATICNNVYSQFKSSTQFANINPAPTVAP